MTCSTRQNASYPTFHEKLVDPLFGNSESVIFLLVDRLRGEKPERFDTMAKFSLVHELLHAFEKTNSSVIIQEGNSFLVVELVLMGFLVENLLNAGVSCHPAVMMSFTTQKQLELLKKRLFEISKDLPEQVEEEYVILYPPVEAKLREAGLKPITVAETGSNRKAT